MRKAPRQMDEMERKVW